ncbi:molybdenum cofactor biosynthesis protein MoaE [Streptomyces carpinensis]|uniref:Molybdenum cofactor biosynthesis protein MoaE n=1 Tax=Streptomyces carpinensis TaxID=66369 RepID=A0ABV1W751_9ACTN|nr:molybdenum cofactor biosynthesis protein MoaE [Streptomyces carpinensis]
MKILSPRAVAISVAVTDEVLDLGAHLRLVESTRTGAVVSFVGQVRDHDPEVVGVVESLEYTCHPDAEQVLRTVVTEVVDELLARGVLTDEARVAATHRVGRLHPGELALVVCTATAHRAECYELNRSVVERIKERIPVWKCQNTDGGERVWSGVA